MIIFSSAFVLLSLFSSVRSWDCGDDTLVKYGNTKIPENVPWSALVRIEYSGEADYCNGIIVSPKIIATHGCSFYAGSSVSIFFNRNGAPEKTPSITMGYPRIKRVDQFNIITLDEEISSSKRHAPICLSDSLPGEYMLDRVYFRWEKKDSGEGLESYHLSIGKNLEDPSAVMYKNTQDHKWYFGGVEFYQRYSNGYVGNHERYEIDALFREVNSTSEEESLRLQRLNDPTNPDSHLYDPSATFLDGTINSIYGWFGGL